MKRLVLVITGLIVGIVMGYAAEDYQINYSQNGSSHELELTINNFQVSNIQEGNQFFSKVLISSGAHLNKKGWAELPVLHTAIQVANQQDYKVEVESIEYEDIQLDHAMLPSRGVIYRNQDPTTIPFETASESVVDKWYPSELVKSTEPYIIRDVRGTSIYFQAFQYNAQRNVLRVHKKIKVKLVEKRGNATNPLTGGSASLTPQMDAIYNSIFINYNTDRDALAHGEHGDILVITTASYETAIEPYIQWKKEKGFLVSKEVVSEGTNVKALIKEKYDDNNDLFYVVLVGDWADIRSDLGTSQNAPMDPMLGCVVGTDDKQDIVIGRFSGMNADQITAQVDKAIAYEKIAATETDWYKNALGIASHEGAGSGDDGESDFQHMDVIWNNKLDPNTYENHTAAYDPGANANQVTTAVNDGVSIINYVGHGSNNSWVTTGFNINDVNNLSNEGKLPFIFSVACVNGSFHTGDCFAEAWLRKENGGAVVMLAATINQPWTPPMRGQDYINDIIKGGYNYEDHAGQNGISTNEQRSFIGSIVLNSMLLMTSEATGSDDWETVKTWTIFGDPTTQIRTDAPKTMALSNQTVMAGVPYTTQVTAAGTPVAGAMVCISQNGNFFRGTTDDGGNVTIDQTLIPGTALRVVTAYNGKTIYEEITVASADGAWIAVNAQEIDDAAANNNQAADFDETFYLDVEAGNVGSQNATGVNAQLTCTDSYITVLDNAHTYGDINANSQVAGDNAFQLKLANNVPDQHPVSCQIVFTDGASETWNSNISFLANAPAFSYGSMTINDASGNTNGILDPGESATVSVVVNNTGHATANNVTVTLETSASGISITNTSATVTEIQAGAEATVEFTVAAEDAMTIGTLVTLNSTITAGEYSANNSFEITVGEIPIYTIDNTTITVCGGKFTDTGGEDGDYSNDESKIMTIKPIGEGSKLKMNFTSFNVEADYDYLYIYDGVDVNADQIAGSPFSGTTSPGEIIATNAEGALTFKFTSDGMVDAAGWVAEVSCETTVSVGTVEKGEIKVYPNPVKDELFIQHSLRAQIDLYSLYGQLINTKISSGGVSSMNMSGMKAGYYVIQITTQNEKISKKILVQ